ncbi:MAG: cell division protein FtsL [Betaproteobacteria bacterium]|nr:cell division protein FtsL [Betaproteobacteria bacterium]MDE2621947.1 cell division protein FtsL [Betaproteobacteria bacterium]
MNRLNAMFFGAVVLLAISVVNAQHRARRLFVDLQKEKDRSEQLVAEWNQLQIEQGTLASSHRIEDGAVRGLQMQVPNTAHVRLIVVGEPEVREVR